MKKKSLILAFFAVAVCFYGCESTSLDEQLDDSSTTVPSEEEQNPDDGAGKTDPNSGGDDDNEVVELPSLPDLEDVDDVCTKMTDLDFMSYCYKNFDVNGDARVSMSEANAVKVISCSTAEDFTGIEYFSNLESFESYSAKILDLRYNTQLSNINFYGWFSGGNYYKSAPIEELDLRYCLNLTSIGERAFYYCSHLTKIDLPSSLTSIGNYAFYYCSGLTSIDFPASLTSIGEFSFTYCAGLTSIDFPASLTSIDFPASLTSIDFPASLTSIGERAFRDCENLESVTSRSVTPPSIYFDTFSYCPSLTTLYVPSESVDAYTNSDWAKYFKTIEAISE